MRSFISRLFCRAFFCSFAILILPAIGTSAEELAPYYFTTLAGHSNRGSIDGTSSEARFLSPTNAAMDSVGNLYVTDSGNHTIRRISLDGEVTTLAGSPGIQGTADGLGSAALFNRPTGVAVDSTGTIYVADSGNHTIRRISPTGVVTTIAGTAGEPGAVDGMGSEARFNYPGGVAIDPAGRILVADTWNHCIRRITSTGEVTTIVGKSGASGSADGSSDTARLYLPQDVAVDTAGNIFVADTYNVTVRKITSDGTVTTLAGKTGKIGSSDGLGSAATFWFPQALAVDLAGNVYVADLFNCLLRRITPNGEVTTLAGSKPVDQIGWADGTGSAARFGYLTGVTLDRSGNVIVVDQWHSTIRRVTARGEVTTVAGGGASNGSTDGPEHMALFYSPGGIAVNSQGDIFVADTGNSTIRRIDSAGNVTTFAGQASQTGSTDGAAQDARFTYPGGLAVDSQSTLYVSETSTHTIRKITAQGTVTTLAGSTGQSGTNDGLGSDARFDRPKGTAVDQAGFIYVADQNAIRRISPAGAVTTFAGKTGIGNAGSTDGPAQEARFLQPTGVAVDQAGNVYVADFRNCTIRKITPSGTVSTLAGKAGSPGSVDGTRSEARFNYPQNLDVDADGNVYVVDSENHTFRKITPEGVVTTLAGRVSSEGSSHDGVGDAVRFFNPSDVAITSTGFAYIADASNNTIRQGQLAEAPVTITQPKSLSVARGSRVQFSVTAAAVPAPIYQWQHDGQPFDGATSSTLSFTNATTNDSGDYSVVITNALGSVTSEKAKLTVTATTTPSTPPTSSGGGGGGGGAPSTWFLAVLSAAAVIRFYRRRI